MLADAARRTSASLCTSSDFVFNGEISTPRTSPPEPAQRLRRVKLRRLFAPRAEHWVLTSSLLVTRKERARSTR
jgi:hypothetical protein